MDDEEDESRDQVTGLGSGLPPRVGARRGHGGSSRSTGARSVGGRSIGGSSTGSRTVRSQSEAGLSEVDYGAGLPGGGMPGGYGATRFGGMVGGLGMGGRLGGSAGGAFCTVGGSTYFSSGWYCERTWRWCWSRSMFALWKDLERDTCCESYGSQMERKWPSVIEARCAPSSVVLVAALAPAGTGQGHRTPHATCTTDTRTHAASLKLTARHTHMRTRYKRAPG